MTESNDQNTTPFSLLAHELLVDVLALTHPRSTVPATSTVTRCIAQENTHLVRSWAHHIIFHASQWSEVEDKLHFGAEAGFFEYDPAARQLVSRLSTWLKTRLPNRSNHLAPTTQVQSSEPVLTAAYVDWLFSIHGPIHRDLGRNPTPWQAQLDTLCGLLHSEDGEDDYPFSHPDRLKPLPHRRWQLAPDAFQLSMYFARAGHIGLLQQSLRHLLKLLPDLALAEMPMSRWSQLMLDNRQHVRTTINLLIDTSADAALAFPVFLCFVGALDWSLPAIQAVASVFPDAALRFTSWLNTCDGAFRGIFDMLGAVIEPDRALSLLDWMYANGLEKRQVDVDPDDPRQAPFMALSAGNARVFGALLTRFDVPFVWPQIADTI
ncbi:hypothetical protein BCR44DRAFT_52738, partial [Catenaria anguillulae PL171]